MTVENEPGEETLEQGAASEVAEGELQEGAGAEPGTGPEGTPPEGSEATPTAEDEWDPNPAMEAMAKRRKSQVKEQRARINELEGLNNKYRQNLSAIRSAAPSWYQKVQQADALASELEQVKGKLVDIESLRAEVEAAKASGWKPDPDDLARIQSSQGIAQLGQRIEHLQRALESGSVPSVASGQAHPSQVDPVLGNLLGTQPAQPMAPGQPFQPVAPEPPPAADQGQQALSYFRGEFSRLALDLGVPELASHEQAVLDRWWRAGGNDTVEDAMQDHLELVYEKRKSRVTRKRQQARTLPKPVPSGSGARPTGPQTVPGAARRRSEHNTGLRKPTSKEDKPHGLDDVARDHMDGRLHQRGR